MDIAAERAYPTPLANSPLLPLLLISLATQRSFPRQASTFKHEYDYVVVGGGSAGSVVASRLSEEPCVTVLLLEAGAKNPPLLSEVPAFARYFWTTDIDWRFKTVPQKHTGYALVNRQVIWPSGLGFGGSSLLNAMLYVRGNRKDYDNWAAQGAKGWSFKEVFPYFLKLEDNRNIDFLQNGYHASGGPVTFENTEYHPEVKKRLLEGAQELGYRVIDTNGPRQTGFFNYQGNIRNGQRCSTDKAYLVPVENRTNLDMVGGAYVKKIVFEGSRAIGVQFDYKNCDYTVRARREVIMTAGTTNTAQLLMLSGIGPRDHLEKLNIPVLVDLPVGNNFQDHCSVILPFLINERPLKEKARDPQTIHEYIDKRTGPLSSAEFISTMAFLGGNEKGEDFPDYELYFAEISKEVPRDQIGLYPILYKLIFGPYEEGPMMVCLSQVLHPRSRGTVRLQSTNPYDPPLIDPNYFDDPADIDPIVKGLNTCREIVSSEPMKKLGARLIPTLFPKIVNLIPDLSLFFRLLARLYVVTMSHQVGTAKMGDPNDPSTVVDPQLRVKGVQGLRVADASVMPVVPSGNTNIPTIMVAEKASDMIKETIPCANREVPNYYDLPDFTDINNLFEHYHYDG